jgi:hypothetical protein
VVDQTVRFQPKARERIMGWIHRLVREDDDVRVYSLSGLSLQAGSALELHDRLTHLLSDRELDAHVSSLFRDGVKDCRKREIEDARNRIEGTARHLLANPVDDRVPSEIVEFFSRLSLADDGAGQRTTIVILSDMMENSRSLYSFYPPHNLDPPKLRGFLDRLSANGTLGYLRNARVYVIGAATVQEHGRVLSWQERGNLERFWREWFDASHADMRMWEETYPTRDPD